MSSGTGGHNAIGRLRPEKDAADAIAVAVELVTAQVNNVPRDLEDALADVDQGAVIEALVAQVTLLLRQVSPKLRHRLLAAWGAGVAKYRAGA